MVEPSHMALAPQTHTLLIKERVERGHSPTGSGDCRCTSS